MTPRGLALGFCVACWACSGGTSSSSSSSGGSSSSSSSSSGFYPGITVPAVWTHATDYADAFAADGEHAFVAFNNTSPPQLLRLNLDGSGATPIASASITQLMEDGPDLFAIVGNGGFELQRIPKDGSAAQSLGTVTDYAVGMALTPTQVIIAVGFNGAHLVAYPRAGGASTVRFEDVTATQSVGHLQAEGEDLWFNNGKDVRVLAQGSSTAPVVMTVAEDFVESIFVDGQDLWVASGVYANPPVTTLYASGKIYRTPRMGGGDVTVVLEKDSGIRNLVVGPQSVFFFNYGYMNQGRVVSVAHDGTAFTRVGWDMAVQGLTLRGSNLIWAAYASEEPYPSGTAMHVVQVDHP